MADGDGDGLAIVDIGSWESPQVPFTGSGYHPLTPARILDTRTGDGAPAGKLGPGGAVSLQVTGRGGVPVGGRARRRPECHRHRADGAELPHRLAGRRTRPLASNLNYAAGQTVANLVTVKVGAGGKVNLLQQRRRTHVVVDVAGWYGTSAGGPGSRPVAGPHPRHPRRRRAPGGRSRARPRRLQVTGQGGVPASGVSAVVLNVTATNTGSDGWLAAWPAGEARRSSPT